MRKPALLASQGDIGTPSSSRARLFSQKEVSMAFCSHCGATIADAAGFCPSCGKAQGAASGAPSAQAKTGLQENVAGLLCYVLGWVTGLIFLVIDRRPYVRFHAAQSIVTFGVLHLVQILLGGWMFGGGMFRWGFGLGALRGLIGIITFGLWIVLMIKAYQGERFKLPLAGDLAEKLAAS
jgi:uncharacterized membrane protein